MALSYPSSHSGPQCWGREGASRPGLAEISICPLPLRASLLSGRQVISGLRFAVERWKLPGGSDHTPCPVLRPGVLPAALQWGTRTPPPWPCTGARSPLQPLNCPLWSQRPGRGAGGLARREPQEEEGKAAPSPPAASRQPCCSSGMACRVGLSHPACHLGAPEGVRVGSIRGSCFAVASALLSWARTSGSNKLKLAQDGEGRAKPQAEPWK